MSATNAELAAGFARQTRAQKFADLLTFLKLLRIRGDQFDYALLGASGTQISDEYSAGSTEVKDDPAWLAHGVDTVRSFDDGSIAIRFVATARWEAYRAW